MSKMTRLQEKYIASLEQQLESLAWRISPAMAEEQIHQLNLKIIQLEGELAIEMVCIKDLRKKQQVQP